MNLCVIVLTSDLDKETRPPKILPKVCYKIGEKSMIEICLENIVRLNPDKIILMVSRHNIFFINKVLKHTDYSKLISFCITDNTSNDLLKNRKISLAQNCYNGKNVLVVPGNAPLLTSRSMQRILSQKQNVKINNNIFYLKEEYLDKIDDISEMTSNNLLTGKEILQIRTQTELEYVQNIFEEKRRIKQSILDK